MSHLTQAPLKILDIAALRAAVSSFGAQLTEKKTFHSYEGENKCDYCISLPNVYYEVGVRREKDGRYSLHHDPFGYENSGGHDGHKLVAAFGTGLGKLCQQYAAQVLKAKSKLNGWTCVQKSLPNGKLQLQMMKL